MAYIGRRQLLAGAAGALAFTAAAEIGRAHV